MVKEIIVLCVVLMTGCSTTVPVTSKFPEVPNSFKVKCPNLKKLKDSDALSQITKTITDNYSTYYECAVRQDAWIEWYEIQKKIHEEFR